MLKHLVTSIALGIATTIVATASELSAATTTNLVIPPYLQNPSPTEMTICFATQGAENVKINYGPAGESKLENISAKRHAVPGTTWIIWKTRLSKLTPNSAYQYQINYTLAGTNASTQVYHFHTFDPASKSIRFIQFNDVHDHGETLAALMKWVKPDDYEFALLVGDMWTNPDAAHNASKVFKTLAAYVPLLNASEKPFFLIRGNHETIGSFSDKMAYLFDLPNLNEKAKFVDQNWYFTLRTGPVWIMAMDGGDDFIKRYDLFQVMRQRQADWMKKQFTQNAGADATWRLFVTHMPLYNTNIWNSEPCRQMWEPLLKDAKFDVELSGHDHSWKRIDKGTTATIVFDGHYPDQQDPQQRKTYTITSIFPVLIGGGPTIKEANVALITADQKTLWVRHIAATDGKIQMEYKQEKP